MSASHRTLQIWTFAIQFGFKYFLLNQKWTYGKAGMTKEAVSARKSELAVWLREGLVSLGPTFIKIGQQFSTRDNVPPFDSDTALEIVQFALGKPVDQVFNTFDTTPIAAASLGQVHLATLGGEKVVVKVQRPGLKSLFDIDLKNIRAL
ncbi:ABC1 domain-containing protein, partial [Haematococcus lacustris]